MIRSGKEANINVSFYVLVINKLNVYVTIIVLAVNKNCYIQSARSFKGRVSQNIFILS